MKGVELTLEQWRRVREAVVITKALHEYCIEHGYEYYLLSTEYGIDCFLCDVALDISNKMGIAKKYDSMAHSLRCSPCPWISLAGYKNPCYSESTKELDNFIDNEKAVIRLGAWIKSIDELIRIMEKTGA